MNARFNTTTQVRGTPFIPGGKVSQPIRSVKVTFVPGKGLLAKLAGSIGTRPEVTAKVDYSKRTITLSAALFSQGPVFLPGNEEKQLFVKGTEGLPAGLWTVVVKDQQRKTILRTEVTAPIVCFPTFPRV